MAAFLRIIQNIMINNYLPTNRTIKALILDMDGVLWRDEDPIGDLLLLFERMYSRYQVMLATNNSTLSAEMYVEKLARFGVHIPSRQIITSAIATALYLKEHHPKGGKVYILGEKGLHRELARHGFTHASQDVLAVVVGMDREINYTKLRDAAALIHKGVPFLGTNPDRTFPTPQGFAPGAGAILAAIEASTDIAPLLIGKPAPEMYRMALKQLDVSPEQSLVVGDRLGTDIAGGQKLGCNTALVLSGVTTLKEAEAWRPKPDYIVDNLAILVDLL